MKTGSTTLPGYIAERGKIDSDSIPNYDNYPYDNLLCQRIVPQRDSCRIELRCIHI